ncbi:MAG: N-acetyl-gamma-glutamyl-phosphate reductase [Alphaproteobacteria bacterium]|nr:N-acetyl-gamma-glutamyl-phosphate reductase [Alphaproteobacteria bacterium]
MAQTNRIRVAVLGASGYTGAELLRILAHHPATEFALLTADRRAGKPLGEVFPHLSFIKAPMLQNLDEVDWSSADVDAVFCGLPHGTTQKVVAAIFAAKRTKKLRVFDLSADFRLRDAETYKTWYGHAHEALALQSRAVYGLTEHARAEIAKTDLVACPGCYPTAALLPLLPLLSDKLIEPGDIIIDSKSGVSGAGRAEKEASLYSEVTEGMHPYGIASHRHAPEIEQSLGDAAKQPITVTFTPHLAPMSRGILSTKYVKLANGAKPADLHAALKARYAGEPFVSLLADKQVPSTRMVRGSNRCVMNVFADRVPGRAIIVSAIDNLVKGAAGQAVQNMNVSFGFKETDGLAQEALFP